MSGAEERRCGLYLAVGETLHLVSVRPGPEDFLLDVLLYPGLWFARPGFLGLAWVAQRLDGGGSAGLLSGWDLVEWIVPPGTNRLAEWVVHQWEAAGLGPLPPLDTLNAVPLFLWIALVPSREVAERLKIPTPTRLAKLLRQKEIPQPVPVGESDDGQRSAMRLWWLGDVLRTQRAREPEMPKSRWFRAADLQRILQRLERGTKQVPVEDAAALVGRSVFSVWRWVRKGWVRAVRDQDRMLIDLSSLAAYVRERLDPDDRKHQR